MGMQVHFSLLDVLEANIDVEISHQRIETPAEDGTMEISYTSTAAMPQCVVSLSGTQCWHDITATDNRAIINFLINNRIPFTAS